MNGLQIKEGLNSSKLIAISGVKGSGKDLASNMIQYCLSVPKIFRRYWIYKYFKNIFPKKYKKLAFADPLKRMLSALLNIPVLRFNDRDFKEMYAIDIDTLNVSRDVFNNSLSDSKFNKLIKNLDPELVESKLTIRQLMQYFGTSIMRTFLGEKVWINSTLRQCDKPTIISDCRFINEYEAIKKENGIVIYVSRPGCWFGQHASEKEMEELLNNNKYDYVINNNGSIKDLFNKIKSICN